MPLWMLLMTAGQAQTTPAGHIEIPSASIATEDGPGTLFVNPANLAFDPDPRFGAFMDRPLGDTGLTSVAAAGGVPGLNLAVQNTFDGLGVLHWEVVTASSIQLPKRIALGAALRWRIVPRRPNVVAYDLAASWRPTSWFGASIVAQTVGDPDITGTIDPQTRYGIALRPGKALTVGLEQIVQYSGSRPDFFSRVNLRIRAARGLYLRGHFQSDADLLSPEGGAALELYFGGSGVAVGGRSDAEQPFVSGWLGTGEPGESLVRGKSRVAVVNLTAAPAYQPSRGLFAAGGPSWLQTLQALHDLETDTQCGGVVITLGSGGLGLARLHELRARLLSLEEAGKPVTAYLTGSIDTGNYYAASAASTILMHPAAVLDLTGLSFELQHYRGLMDMVGVQAQVVRRAEYKSAAESFTRTQPSAEQLEQMNTLLDDLFAEVVSGVAAGRDLSEERVRTHIDGAPYLAEEAEQVGLIDQVVYPDEVDESIGSGSERFVHLSDLPDPTSPWKTTSRIAVIYIDGTINSGASSEGGLLSSRSAGSSTVVRQLDQARRDPAVKAVVLRVDSPGGSAFASDEILRAAERCKDKPLVVSMGGLAASGGYYVATKADAIWALPTTLTGSIGVVSFKLSADPLFDTLGVSSTRLERGANAGINSSFSPWDQAEKQRSQDIVDGIYSQFKGHVMVGRDLSEQAVEEVARGRIWSGTRAVENGLVDELGGLIEAIEDAKQRAGIPERRDVEVISSSTPASLTEQLNPIPALRAQASAPPALLEAFGPILTFALHPDEHTWMLEPWVREVQ